MLGLMLIPLVASLTHAAPAQIEPAGELKARIEMVRDRMTVGSEPRFTDDFILADLMISPDYPRRFTEYSGDLSGRVIEAWSTMPDPAHAAALDALVHRALTYQKPDGRFGDASLKFTPSDVKMEHMALLWGNGRFLVGLMAYQQAHPAPEVLEAARKLGDFLLSTYAACANEEVRNRVRDLAAAGMICYSQIIEGLVPLAQATGDNRYLEGAEQVAPWLPEGRAQQHAHGYMTTLRGILMLYEATKKPQYLDMVERMYKDLVHSPDNLIYGGAMEMFGGKGDRDEGCAEADFVRLSLALAHVTGNADYLERAERCLLNEFFANQFSTGDFGHHQYASYGVLPSPGAGRAWWCCTMHGMRALRDVCDSIVAKDGDALRVDLFLDARWSDGDHTLALAHKTDGFNTGLSVKVEKAPEKGVRLAFRKPAWAAEVRVFSNGVALAAKDNGVRLTLDEPIKTGDRVEATFTPTLRIIKRDGNVLSLDQLGAKAVEGVLFCGPYLVGVDEAFNTPFFGEPWMGNEVYLPSQPKSGESGDSPLNVPQARVACTYVHEGFPLPNALTLSAMSERTLHQPAMFGAWLRYKKAP